MQEFYSWLFSSRGQIVVLREYLEDPEKGSFLTVLGGGRRGHFGPLGPPPEGPPGGPEKGQKGPPGAISAAAPSK